MAFLIIGWIFVPPIGRRSRYGYYKLFVGEEAKDNLMKYALIARKAECDTPENHLCLRKDDYYGAKNEAKN